MAEPGTLGQVYEEEKSEEALEAGRCADALSNQGAVPTNTWILGMQRQVRAIDLQRALLGPVRCPHAVHHHRDTL